MLTTLHTFGGLDGYTPYAGLALGTDGNFYGTTTSGGDSCSGEYTCGTVFRITPGGTLTTLHDFDDSDGAEPLGVLVLGTNGNFYGTTIQGGAAGYGTVFEITPKGTLTTVVDFNPDGGGPFGGGPEAGLALGSDGNFYGTSLYSGCAIGCGTVFETTPDGVFTNLHTFSGPDGLNPTGGLFQSTGGTFYGTTHEGGRSNNCRYGCGTLFSLDMGLGPFVSFVRNPAEVGQAFGILGQGFTGTTSVELNGIPATFTVVSNTFIKATVPAGATTGYVTVTTPSGTLTSNVPFRVIP